MAFEIGLPKDFKVTNDYNSHRPLLYMALQNVPQGTVMELGCGEGSTFSLAKYCDLQSRNFVSFERDPGWQNKLKGFTTLLLEPSYMSVFEKLGALMPAIVFIDSAPGEERKDLLRQWKDNATVLIVHDSEEGAEYVYGMKEVLSSFISRVDLHIPGHPSTTAVSNKIDLGYWKQYAAGGYKLV